MEKNLKDRGKIHQLCNYLIVLPTVPLIIPCSHLIENNILSEKYFKSVNKK